MPEKKLRRNRLFNPRKISELCPRNQFSTEKKIKKVGENQKWARILPKKRERVNEKPDFFGGEESKSERGGGAFVPSAPLGYAHENLCSLHVCGPLNSSNTSMNIPHIMCAINRDQCNKQHIGTTMVSLIKAFIKVLQTLIL